MIEWYRTSDHTITSMKVHIVRCTKYRYKVLEWAIQSKCREILIQICKYLDIVILKWVVSKDHVHLFIEYPPKYSISDIVKRFKWTTSRKLMLEFKDLEKRYWWRHFRWIGYFASSSGNITDEMIEFYLEHHRTWYDDIKQYNDFILE